MSGLLRSLGAQALDRVPALRPAARLRGAEMLWANQERDRASASETQAFDDAPIEARSAPSTANPASSGRPKPVRPAIDDDTARESVRDKRATTMIATGDTMSVRGPIVRSRIAEDLQRRTLVAPDENDSAATLARRSGPPERHAAVTTTTTTTTANPARRHDHRARSDDPVAFARRTREPALPDVQIHIGRIELTAVTAPASAPRTAPPGRKPMSLDDYLRERTRKTP